MSDITNCLQSITIAPGGTISIPGTAKIIAVDATDITDIESSCSSLEEQLENAEAYACYEFAWEADYGTAGETGTWQNDEVTIVQLEIGTNVYELDVDSNSTTVESLYTSIIPAKVPQGLLKVTGWDSNRTSDKDRLTLCFNTLPSIASSIRLKFSNARQNDSVADAIYYIYARENTGFCACATGGGA